MALPREKRPFNCTEKDCVYRSSRASNMRRHSLVHSLSPKPCMYACDVEGCSYRSRFKASLEPHRRRHTGDRPYSCSVPGCNFSTAWSSLRTKHYLTAHGVSGQKGATAALAAVMPASFAATPALPPAGPLIFERESPSFTLVDITDASAETRTPFCTLYVSPHVSASSATLVIGGFLTADVDMAKLGSAELNSQLLQAALHAIVRKSQ